ncbi:unnamed protein product [Didymodactylos carnosus]|uniref:HAT C-terminal dimerisation domain-containing protein n=2 Tax=Didymodactylos carnosus TaxID=1234261 RepID=A0A8S2HMW9_9BILA|nr:unnamed protein product [Didymodactylos carnosus]CAF3660355.1 unnamed protein product [Didymodactylos carnosus]
MNTKGHLTNMKSLKQNSTFVFESSKTTAFASDAVPRTTQLILDNVRKSEMLNFDEQVTKAEIVWALTASQRGYSYNSCDELGDVFRTMFPDSKIAEQFSIQSKKMSYDMSHGLGPYFHRRLIEDLKRNEKFVLCFDEQINHQNNKQLDLLVKYWCHDKGLVVTRYYKSVLLGHAQANVLQNVIIDSFKTDGLDLKCLLMLGRDNPSVNISLENLIDQLMKKLGSCISSTGWHVENICTEIYSWFKRSPARKEDLVRVTNEYNDLVESTLLYFVITRGILLGKVIARVLTLWEALNEYFLVFLPSNQKVQIRDNDRYDPIKSNLTSSVAKIRLQFVLFLSDGDLLDLDFKLNEKQLNNTHIRIGEGARKLLTELTQQQREKFFEDVKKMYHGIAQYFKLNLPLKNSFLRDVQILHPLLQSVQTTDQINRIARAVPCLLNDSEIDRLRDEWLAYSIGDIDEKWSIKEQKKDSAGNNHIVYQRIDYYWNHIFAIITTDGRAKYPILAKLIKNILIIPHGNADVERGFSINENIVTENRSLLSESSINGLRSSYDAVKFAGRGSSHKVPVNKEMIQAVQKSSSLYKEELAKVKAAMERMENEKKERGNAEEINKQILKEDNYY